MAFLSAARPRLPLTVIGGFLGAGKTTLLNRLLADAGGRRLAVLVNDFGALNIDAALVASNDGDTVALTNGCVCCSIGDDLTDALIRVIEAQPAFDAVVIEASGVSDPWRIAQVGLADPALMLDSVLVLVDASAVLEQAADRLLADSLARQVASADFIVMNKCDIAAPAMLAAVRAWIASHTPSTPVFETSDAIVPPEVTRGLSVDRASSIDERRFDADLRDADRAHHGRDHAEDHSHDHDHDHDHTHSHSHATQFDTWSAQPAASFQASVLRSWLKAVPAGVLRLKGIVATDEHGWAEIQFAGRHGSIRKATGGPVAGAAVVAIGLRGRLPVHELRSTFEARSAASPASAAGH